MAHPNLQFQSNMFFLSAIENFIQPQLSLGEVTGIKRVPFALVTSEKRGAWPRMTTVSRTFITEGVFMFLLISYCTLKIEAINYAWPKPLRNCKGTTLKRNGPRTEESAGSEEEFLTTILWNAPSHALGFGDH